MVASIVDRANPRQSSGKGLCLRPMPAIKITAETSLPPNECFTRVTKMFENDADLKKLDSKFVCRFDEKSLSGTAEGKLFKANMKILAAAQGSAVEIQVDLPFHLALVKGMVQKTLEKKLSSALA